MNDKEKRKKDLLEELAVLYKNDISNKDIKIDSKKIEEKRKANVKDYFKGFYKEFEMMIPKVYFEQEEKAEISEKKNNKNEKEIILSEYFI